VEGLLFTLLPLPQSRWKSFVTGWTLQAVSLMGILLAGARFHQELIPAADYRVTNLVSYEPQVLHEPGLVAPTALTRFESTPQSKPSQESKPTVAALVVAHQIHTLSEPKPQADRPAPELKLDSSMPVIPIAPTSKIVAIGTFSPSNPTTATATRPSPSVQTGGFGDPNGVPASQHHAAGNVGETGSFDLATGSDHGKGAAGTNSGMVMSSGFGNGAVDAASIHGKTASHQPGNGANAPVEITFEPKPDYTDEGRKQKINGEVRLEVLFRSDGQIHVIRVLQGLGHGLDEQAVKAAEQIKFKPALRQGQPIDSLAQVHIIFEIIS
jgi:TonB family protein